MWHSDFHVAINMILLVFFIFAAFDVAMRYATPKHVQARWPWVSFMNGLTAGIFIRMLYVVDFKRPEHSGLWVMNGQWDHGIIVARSLLAEYLTGRYLIVLNRE